MSLPMRKCRHAGGGGTVLSRRNFISDRAERHFLKTVLGLTCDAPVHRQGLIKPPFVIQLLPAEPSPLSGCR
jgi:hypothetical protein